jgi:glucan phosphoethanolaminetransferase (alkaline phosphatase superfamily)
MIHYLYTILFFIYAASLIKRQQYLTGSLYGTLVSLLAPVLHKFFATVGADSLMELQHFDFTEAIFFLGTVLNTFDFYFRLERFFYYLLFFLVVVVLMQSNHSFVIFATNKKHFIVSLATILFLVNEFTYFQLNSWVYYKVRKNFTLMNDYNLKPSNLELTSIIYIGESSSAYNFSLYDYPQLNTPNLNRLFGENKLLKFDALSNYTMTTQSLLEALSLPKSFNSKEKLIYDQKRVPVTDLLTKAGLSLELFSNQGKNSTVNLASSTIFGNTNSQFSQDVSFVGDKDTHLKKPFDHEFLIPGLSALLNNQKADVIFLHSYAGHGPYHKFIPDDFKGKQHIFDKYSLPEIFKDHMNKEGLLEDLKIYDQSIAYIDHNINTIVKKIKDLNQPVMFLYFSDHGDNVFDGTGHDSRWLDASMLNVPFVIYLNDAARIKYPDIWDSLRIDAQHL